MIVKDESKIIGELLKSISKYIDYYIISDTGSTDNTKQIIKDYFDELNIDGEIHDDIWVNFGYNRSKALEHCKGKCEYCWVMDADDIIVGDMTLPLEMNDDSYYLNIGKDFTWKRKQILKVDKNWKYVGVLHEYVMSDIAVTEETIEGDYYIDARTIGNRSCDPDKYKKDADILLKALEEEPNNYRYMFYLAQSYADCNEYEKSNEYYLKRFNFGGWGEELYYSLYKIGVNNIKLNKSKEVIVESLVRAFKYRPSRIEPLYQLVNYLYYNEQNKDTKEAAKYAKLGLMLNTTLTKDLLFVSKHIYEYKFLDLAYLALYYNNDFDDAYKCINILLKRKKFPIDHLSRLEKNRDFCIPKIIDKYI